MKYPQDAAAAQVRQHALTMVGRVLNVENQEGKVKALIGFMPAVWAPNTHDEALSTISLWVKVEGLKIKYWLVETLNDIGESIGVVEEVCLTETKVRVKLLCDQPLDFPWSWNMRRRDALYAFQDRNMIDCSPKDPTGMTRGIADIGKTVRNYGEPRNHLQSRDNPEGSQSHNGYQGTNPARPPLQRQLLPEFTAVMETREERERKMVVENRLSTKNWVRTAFGKAEKDGVMIDMDKLNQARFGVEETQVTAPMTGEIPAKVIAPTNQETSATFQISHTAGKLATTASSGQVQVASTRPGMMKKIPAVVIEPEAKERPTEKSKSIIVDSINKMAQVEKKWPQRRFLTSPLRENMFPYRIRKKGGKQAKGFKNALHGVKKIGNTPVKKGRMTMKDYASVEKMGPDKGKKANNLVVLVGGDLPVKT
ncbi:unnamed protein product [Cochlearia groenlandica]